MDEAKKDFPKWESLYEDATVETMPWYHPSLDPDLAKALDNLGISGGSILDLGTGPATQAVELAKMGFQVMGTDISGAAIKRAAEIATGMGLSIDFYRDDILKSGLDKSFDCIFDRGCFHTLPPEHRDAYMRALEKISSPGGYLFLKCFSHKEPMSDGPYRFRPAEIEELFSGSFQILSIEESVYQGTLDPYPIALFCVMRKKASSP